MRYHIVRTTDTIDRIANIYNMTIQEIKNSNEHISDWKKLIPGTKIRLPAIPDHVRDELDDTEPFIEDYYPKIHHKIEPNIIEPEELNEKINDEEVEDNNHVENNLPSYSYYYPPYYFYPTRKIKKFRGRA